MKVLIMQRYGGKKHREERVGEAQTASNASCISVALPSGGERVSSAEASSTRKQQSHRPKLWPSEP